MSRYSYAGTFKNPAEGYYVKEVGDHYEIWVRYDRESDRSARPDEPLKKKGQVLKFDEQEDAIESIESTREFFEEDYDSYLEENHLEISRMEAYEQFRNEY